MKEKKGLIEVCVYNSRSAINAQNGGAQRIELCDNMYEGGTTPSFAMIKTMKDRLDIDINVMIRPRGGDFVYNEMEFEIMKSDILKCKEIGVNGVVFGVLKVNGEIDTNRTRILIDYARPLSVTFHRAFDMTQDIFRSLDDLISIGIDRVLTSGAKNTAIEGIETLKQLVRQSDNRIVIMPGSGINHENIKEIFEKTGATEYHMSGKRPVDSKLTFRKEGISMGGIKGINEYKLFITEAHIISKTIQALY